MHAHRLVSNNLEHRQRKKKPAIDGADADRRLFMNRRATGKNLEKIPGK